MASIKNGEKGPQVVLLQGILQKLEFGIKSDGIFGEETQEAVQQFQHEVGLETDGKVGDKTAEELVRALHYGRDEVKTV